MLLRNERWEQFITIPTLGSPHEILASQDVKWCLWSHNVVSGVTANETIMVLSPWLTQNLGQLSALMRNHWRMPSQMKTVYLVMKNVFSWSLHFFPIFPNKHVLMVPTVAEASKAEPQQCPALCLGLGGGGYADSWTCNLSLLVTHPLSSLWVIFCSLCFLSSLTGTEICYSTASQVHEYLCLSESSSRRSGWTGFTVLLGTIAVKTLLSEGFFPVLWALIISFPVHYYTAIVSLGLFLAAE